MRAYGSRPLYAATEDAMLAAPEHWAGHYPGSPDRQRVDRHYSLSDRIRYSWGEPRVVAAVERLIATLDGSAVPAPLFRQHLPAFEVFAGKPLKPAEVVMASVRLGLDDYRLAASGAA